MRRPCLVEGSAGEFGRSRDSLDHELNAVNSHQLDGVAARCRMPAPNGSCGPERATGVLGPLGCKGQGVCKTCRGSLGRFRLRAMKGHAIPRRELGPRPSPILCLSKSAMLSRDPARADAEPATSSAHRGWATYFSSASSHAQHERQVCWMNRAGPDDVSWAAMARVRGGGCGRRQKHDGNGIICRGDCAFQVILGPSTIKSQRGFS